MQQKINPKLWWVALAGCLFAWAGIGIQLYDTLEIRQLSIPNTLIKFFSYFTILVNLLVALHYSAIVFASGSAMSRFFRKHSSTTAIAAYILVVGIIYNISLRSIWTFTGWGRLSNELLHTVTPVCFLLYWLFITVKEKLSFRVIIYWMAFPLLYLVYSLIRGTIVHSYPYPFIDVNSLGYSSVIVNCLGVAALFFILFTVFIVINNRLKRSL
jgi:hypothetical protein